MHAHQLCCGRPLESCPVRRDLIREAALVIRDLDRLGYRVGRRTLPVVDPVTGELHIEWPG
jgi:hypothetical protein